MSTFNTIQFLKVFSDHLSATPAFAEDETDLLKVTDFCIDAMEIKADLSARMLYFANNCLDLFPYKEAPQPYTQKIGLVGTQIAKAARLPNSKLIAAITSFNAAIVTIANTQKNSISPEEQRRISENTNYYLGY